MPFNFNQTNFEHTFQAKVTFLSNTFFGGEGIDISKNTKLDVNGTANFFSKSVFADVDVKNLNITSGANITGLTTFNNINIDGELRDGDGDFGSSGQVLSSDGIDTKWVNAGSLSAGVAAEVSVSDDANSDASRFVTFVDSASGSNAIKTDASIKYNPSSNQLSAGSFSGSIDASNVDSGTLGAGRIPNLDAGKITTGTLGSDRIPNLDAGKITTGTLGTGRIPNLDAGKITTGTLGSDRIPNLDAGKITTGTLGSDRIPSLNASKINAGTFAVARLGTGTPSSNNFLRGDGAWTSISFPDGDKITEGTAQVECIGVGSSVITTTNGVERFVVTNDGHVYTPFDSTAKFGIKMSPNSPIPTHDLQVKGDMEVREIDVLHKSFLRGSVYYQGSDDNQNTSIGGVRHLDLRASGMFYRYETQPFANWIPNFRHNQSTVNDETFEGSTFTVTVLVKQRSAGTPDGVTVTEARVDGTATGVDLVWEGGTAPPPSPGTGWDLWEFVVMKTSSTPTYQVFGRRSSTTAQPAGMTHSNKTSAYTLTASDDNRLITTTAGITVPANIFSAAEATTIYNNSSSSITITPAGGVTLRLSGSNITGTRTLAQRGVCTIMCVASNEFIITGSGLA